MNALQLDTLAAYATWAAGAARSSAYKANAALRYDTSIETQNEMIDNHFVYEVKLSVQQLMRIINS